MSTQQDYHHLAIWLSPRSAARARMRHRTCAIIFIALVRGASAGSIMYKDVLENTSGASWGRASCGLACGRVLLKVKERERAQHPLGPCFLFRFAKVRVRQSCTQYPCVVCRCAARLGVQTRRGRLVTPPRTCTVNGMCSVCWRRRETVDQFLWRQILPGNKSLPYPCSKPSPTAMSSR